MEKDLSKMTSFWYPAIVYLSPVAAYIFVTPAVGWIVPLGWLIANIYFMGAFHASLNQSLATLTAPPPKEIAKESEGGM